MNLPSGALPVAAEIGQIAAAPGAAQQRAEALLDPLRRLVPFQAAGVFLLDPGRQVMQPMVSQGYEAAVAEYITSPANAEEVELLGFSRMRLPLRVGDLPIPPEQVRGWTEYLRPAGFREGLCVGLFAPDGRHLGVLGLNTDTDQHPSADARDLIGVLAPTIAAAVDPLRSISTVASIVGDAQSGVIVTSAGRLLPLPGLPAHPLLEAGSAVLTTATALLSAAQVHASFLCPYPTDDRPNGHVRITVLASPPDAVTAAAVMVSPPGDLRRLTAREVQILGLLVEGWPTERIAAALVVSQRTVNTHLEHIRAKLGVATRTLAAVRAMRFGLYVPRPLNGVPE